VIAGGKPEWQGAAIPGISNRGGIQISGSPVAWLNSVWYCSIVFLLNDLKRRKS
jgi:hypothetical protein